MEPRFGYDFSGVRVHTDSRASESARAVNALAYTVGRDIVFGAGKYAPQTSGGRRLLAHELIHTIQQAHGAPESLQKATALQVSDPSDAHEQQADAQAARVMEGYTVHPTPVPGQAGVARLQRSILDSFGCTRLPDPITGILGCVSLPGPTGCEGRGGTCTAHGPGGVLGCWCELPSPPVPLPGPAIPTPLPGPTGLPPITPTPPTGAGPAPVAPSPAPGPAPALGPAPAPAVPPVVTDITVANQAAAITYPEPSVAGPAGGQHFVTVAGSGPDVIVEVTTTGGPVTPGSITWTGATPDPGNPARATLSRATAGKRPVTASAGGGTASLTVWAVFVRVTSTAAALTPAPTGAAPFFRGANINFTGTVFPASIITDPNRPNLAGANTVNPAGNNYCGLALAGGVNAKWDMSRQIDQETINPSAIPVPAGQNPCFWNRVNFPADNAEGNDDANVVGENNNPYAGGGVITSLDTPGQPLPDAAGANGDTLQFNWIFREFARLEYHRTWWLVSNRLAWEVRIRARKVAGRWVDNGSTAAP